MLFVFFIKESKNRFYFLSIKLKEADSDIHLALRTKKNILERMTKIINKVDKYKDDFSDFTQKFNGIENSFILHNTASKYYAKISKVLFEDDDIAGEEKIVDLLNKLKNNEEILIGAIKFYNDTVVDFNGLLKVFPHKFIAKLLGYGEKEFYSNEKEELFEILK